MKTLEETEKAALYNNLPETLERLQTYKYFEDNFYKRKIFCALDTYDTILPLVKSKDIVVSKHAFIKPGTYIMTKDIDRRFDEVDLQMKQDSDTLTTCMVSAKPNFY